MIARFGPKINIRGKGCRLTAITVVADAYQAAIAVKSPRYAPNTASPGWEAIFATLNVTSSGNAIQKAPYDVNAPRELRQSVARSSCIVVYSGVVWSVPITIELPDLNSQGKFNLSRGARFW